MKENNRILTKFTVANLDRIIIALLTNCSNKKFVSNVSRLFGDLRLDLFKAEYDKEVRVYLITQLTNCILDKGLTTSEKILSYLDIDGKYYEDAVPILNGLFNEELPDNELQLLDHLVSNLLKYSSIYEKSEELSSQLLSFQANDFVDIESAVEDIEASIESLNKNMKEARESIENAKYDLSLSNSGFISTLKDIITEKKNPSNKVKTGIQYLNTMLNGGYEKGRLYVACGMAKGFKSGFMLNSVIWAKKYNHLEAENKSLRPCIVYLSMENQNNETIERIWAHCFGNNSSIANYSEVEASQMLEKAGIFTPNDPTSPEIVIWYRPNRSINTTDLNLMLEDLKKEGRECVFLVLDYIRRIRPTEGSKDLRIELSNVTNELKTIAIEQNIPILTGSQLNRDAFNTVDSADTFEAKVRAADRLGASNIGESIDIVQNSDVSFIVNKMQKVVYDEDGMVQYNDRYLFVKLLMSRSKQPTITSFKHRFKDDNDMALMDDFTEAKPRSINNDVELVKDIINKDGTKSKGRKIV